MSTFPLATLAAQITPTGITAPSFNDILNSLIASFQSIFGSDILITPDTQEFQWIVVIALAQHDSNQTFIAVYNSYPPTFAQGAGLSAMVKINGLQRQIPTKSTVQLTVTGVVGTVITSGVAQDGTQQLWDMPATVTIPASGTITVTGTARNVGASIAPAGTVITIFNPQLGWQTVNNAADAVVGAAVETDAALRRRQAVSTGLPSQTPLQGITAAVANVIGVIRSIVYENSSNTTDSNGIPSHSIAVVVQGGDVTQMAQVIESKKSPGTGTFGTTSITVNDPGGLPVTIKFFQLSLLTIYVSITLHPLAGYVSSTATAVIAAIVSFINSLPIGSTVYYNWLLAAGGLIETPLGETFSIVAMTIGTSPAPVGTANIAVPFTSAATSATANIVQTLG